MVNSLANWSELTRTSKTAVLVVPSVVDELIVAMPDVVDASRAGIAREPNVTMARPKR